MTTLLPTPTAHFVLTVGLTDETTTEPDVIAACEVNSQHEVYPEALAVPVDADPVWVSPQAAACLTPEALKFVLDAVTIAVEGADTDTPEGVWTWLDTVRANVDLTDPWGPARAAQAAE